MTLHRLHRRLAPAGAVAALLLVGVAGPAAAATPPEDPSLDQTLEELSIVHGDRVLDAGHVDMGPKFEEDGTWRFLIHDDVARADANATSVWRYPDETVFHVVDAAALAVPDDAAYAFLGAEPGTEVYVVPQTQHPEVVWLGWNTQDPEVMATIDRGVTLSLTDVEGPGQVNVYLQSGSFGEPQQLWDSRVTDPQPLWVDVNTHTHANWVFSAPGVYLMRLTAEADLIDGTTVSDTQTLRFAVGSATAPSDALAAAADAQTDTSTAPPEPTDGAADAAPDADADSDGETTDPLVPILIGAIGVVAVGLIVGVIVAVVRGNRAKARALAGRSSTEEQGS